MHCIKDENSPGLAFCSLVFITSTGWVRAVATTAAMKLEEK
jgi:hypothetical protein